jgi:hypothetical protein
MMFTALADRSFIRVLLVGVLAASCSPGNSDRSDRTVGAGPGSGTGAAPPGGVVIDTDGGPAGMTNAEICARYGGWACGIKDCGAAPKTTVRAKVYDPAGKNPLYNVVVYVNNAPVNAITNGATCETCATPVSGTPIASALTNAQGEFVMEDVPVGTNIPFVIQIGKWRRQITVPEVKACQENVFADPNLFRLPRNQSEGNIPKIAIAVGDADRLQCLFTRIGVDASEFTNPDGTGAINIYNQPADPDKGGAYDTGAVYPPAVPFWEDVNQLMKYDMVLLACAGVNSATNPFEDNNYITATAKSAMVQYVNAGGRVMAEHYHWAWIKSFQDSSNDLPDISSPFPREVATWVTPVSTEAIGTSILTTVDTSFPKGQAMADWLVTVGAAATAGTLTLTGEVKPTAVDHLPPTSQRWIYEPASSTAPTGAAMRTHYFSFNTPITAAVDQQCGRFVYTGLHVTTADSSKADSKTRFPSCCQVRDLITPEKALEFMVFDLSSCVSQIDKPPPNPAIVQ